MASRSTWAASVRWQLKLNLLPDPTARREPIPALFRHRLNMNITIEPFPRSFDGRTVYRWNLIDKSRRLRDSGCELTSAAAKRAAKRSIHAQGPSQLLDMLECRHV